MIPDFFDLNYLSRGSLVQQRGFNAIISSGIMSLLKDFSPVVVGTLPLDLFTSKSDIDIICYCTDVGKFKSVFHHSVTKKLDDIESVIAKFDYDGFEFEVVAQPVPVTKQVAYRHMIIEWKILEEKGPVFKEKVMSLKNAGVKTEPAFAQLLGLEGEPYVAVLNYLG